MLSPDVRPRPSPRAICVATAVAVGLFSVPALAAFADLPAGWFKAGSHPAEYDMGLDESVRRDTGKSSATVKSVVEKPAGIRHPDADVTTRRVPRQARASLRVREVRQGQRSGPGLWFRVDGPNNSTLAFDNMQQRAIKGTTDWTATRSCSTCPTRRERLAFGILLAGGGQVWMDDLNFEVVPATVKTTGGPMVAAGAPTNLNFEK